MKKKQKKQMPDTVVKGIEKQVGEKVNFVGLGPIEDLEEMIRTGRVEKVPGTDDLYRLKQKYPLI